MKLRYPSEGLRVLCGLFGLTRHAYYKAVKRKEQQDIRDHLMIKKVKKLRQDLPGTGTRRLHHMTISYRKKHGIKMGRDKLHEVLRKADMHISFKKRRTRTTTQIMGISDIKT